MPPYTHLTSLPPGIYGDQRNPTQSSPSSARRTDRGHQRPLSQCTAHQSTDTTVNPTGATGPGHRTTHKGDSTAHHSTGLTKASPPPHGHGSIVQNAEDVALWITQSRGGSNNTGGTRRQTMKGQRGDRVGATSEQ